MEADIVRVVTAELIAGLAYLHEQGLGAHPLWWLLSLRLGCC